MRLRTRLLTTLLPALVALTMAMAAAGSRNVRKSPRNDR